MLNRDFILNEWIPALRSGQYRQGTGALCRVVKKEYTEEEIPSTEFCCLGVACDLLMKKGFLHSWESTRSDYYVVPATTDKDKLAVLFPNTEQEGESHILPRRVAAYLGMSVNGSELSMIVKTDEDEEYTCNSLVAANDCKISFGKIADALEDLVRESE